MHELTLLAPAALVDAASDFLVDEHAALSVSVEDADAGTERERPVFGEPGSTPDDTAWEQSIVKALFADKAGAVAAAAGVGATFGSLGVRLRGTGALDNVDWVRQSQAQFAPSRIAGGFWVVPSWHQPPADATRVIRLDPGLAFGTGTHPTTRMCLRWIAAGHGADEAATASGHGGRGTRDVAVSTLPGAPGLRGSRVLDYGCGSGILAIGAALFGAAHVDAVDIDPAAVDAARANALANGVAIVTGLPEVASGRYAVVLANILASPLKLLAPLLCSHLDAGGQLVLAGILERQADELTAAYASWLRLAVTDVEDGWVLMTGRRSTDARMA